MKKFISLFVAGSMLLSLSACAQTNAVTPTGTTSAPEATATATTAAPATEAPEISGYNLLWHDEFDGDTLNEEIWTRELREPGWTNNELQAYTASDENIYVENGSLVLRALKTVDENGHASYTSGKVNSQNKADFMYGKVVVRAKVPEGQGLWPAAWMMPQDESFYGQWPECGEIDILEVLGHDTATAYTTIHYGLPHGQQQGLLTLDEGSFSEDFHEFSVEWEPGEIRFYVDDTLTLTCNDWFTADSAGSEEDYPAPFNQPFFVQLNLAVGGDWPGNPDDTTNFDEAKYQIDYVRVYQKDEYDTNVTKPVFEAREPDDSGNFVVNGDFSDATIDLTTDEDWNFLLYNGGEGAAEIRDNMIVITSTNEGTVDYSVQLVFWDIPFEQGKTYRVTFDVMSDEERDIITCVSAPFVDWVRYYPDTHITVGTEWQTETYEFEMTGKTDPRGRLEFNLGHLGSTATVYITNVRVEVVE